MKKSTKAVIAAVPASFAVSTCIGMALDRMSAERLKKEPKPLPEGFTVTGHTGCLDPDGNQSPDNTPEAVTCAYKCSADIVEIDLRFADDGTPVLAHNSVRGIPVSELHTLEEAFTLLAEYKNMQINIDVKDTANLRAVKRLAKHYGVYDRIFFTGIDLGKMPSVRRQNLGIPYYVNLNVFPPFNSILLLPQALVAITKATGAMGINFNYTGASERIFNAFRRASMKVSVWTVNKENDIRRISALAPDNITSRNPYLVAVMTGKLNRLRVNDNDHCA